MMNDQKTLVSARKSIRDTTSQKMTRGVVLGGRSFVSFLKTVDLDLEFVRNPEFILHQTVLRGILIAVLNVPETFR